MKQVVLVTGAASGLGNVIAEYFAAQGHQVIISASSLEKAENAKARSQYAENMFALKLDISVEADFHAAVQWIQEKFSKLDVLVNNAKIGRAHV